MTTMWLALLGFLFCGYLALAGVDYGTGLLMRVLATDATESRRVLGAAGPVFLGNEVWLVAAAGVLFGAFPRLEGDLLSGAYPVVVATLLGVVAFTAAVQLRSRRPEGRKGLWDGVILLSAATISTGWGAFVAHTLGGSAVGQLVCGTTLLALVLVHGSAFLAVRGPVRARAARVGRVVAPAASALVALAVFAGWPWQRVAHPAFALALAVVLVVLPLAARSLLAQHRFRLAFGATAATLVCAGALVFAARLPVTAAIAATPTLTVLTWFAVPVVPIVVVLQAITWWTARPGRVFW
ncbi:cytochrome d ubiquinol oxidase subunit II [Labedaea rhizosphaerae]|uniref:Cytochrome bd-type quinol oxidase subunit 2 n=1 Tax=Labedaea rhizosphaerae TaxID=598644 RepID=A0A4R6S3L3_LABRH|nr:cytochrome d ubiquinol oxidase subunit II [Labedaea rhizosphaerae]TDP93804.1 cytochrome bd-type quinol oxidase subunit 2 [Labedaea rhizosphaerae]